MEPVRGVEDGVWRGIASFSQSVLCQDEPFNTKAIFQRVVVRAMELLTERLGLVPFVQVGANDGVHADQIRPFVLSGKWQGVLIEPAPIVFERLLRNYHGVRGLSFAQVAISTSPGPLPFYYVEGEDGLSSFALDTILSHAPKYDDLQSMIRELEVQVATLDAVCDEYSIAPAVVAVDAEGTDDIVLESFSLEERKPSLILFEHCHLSAERSSALRDRLVRARYQVIHDRHDALAIADGTFEQGETEFFADIVATARSIAAPKARSPLEPNKA